MSASASNVQYKLAGLQVIPDLSYDKFKEFHGRYYHPSNARFAPALVPCLHRRDAWPIPDVVRHWLL